MGIERETKIGGRDTEMGDREKQRWGIERDKDGD